MKKPSALSATVYRIYRLIPFVLELRTLLDWMVLKSSLDMWDSFKLEDIYSSMFLIQCDILYRKDHPRGGVRPWTSKIGNALLIFLLLIVILFAPLLLFRLSRVCFVWLVSLHMRLLTLVVCSSANPATSSNNVTGTQISVFAIGLVG